EFFKVPARNAFRLPDSVTFEEGGLIADAVVTSIHAAKRGNLVAGSTAVVIGCGGVGLCLVQALVGASIQVAAVDVNQTKLSLAQGYGASAAFLAHSAASEVLAWSGEDGVRCVFDCVGLGQSLESA